MEKIRIALMRQWVRTVGQQQKDDVRLEDKLTLHLPVEELRRGHSWRAVLDAQLQERGVLPQHIVSVNILAQPYHGCHAAVTLLPEEQGAGPVRRRPVTRGGRPIDTPKRHRTRAVLRRGS